jgi:pilus assembly protein CpaB
VGKWKAIIPIISALVIAAVGSVFLYKFIQKQTAPKEVVRVETEAVPVAVAAVDLTWGTKLEGEMLKTIAFLRESLPPGYYSDSGSIKGRIVIAQIKKNEPVIESKLAPENITGGGVSAIVKHGYRAIAVKGDKIIGISGFIKPGNRVDVLVTFTDPRNKREITKIVLENILVLATGQKMEEGPHGEVAPVDVYTLEVTPHDAEKLALAASRGRLQFALRNIMDTETVLTRGATIPKTLSSYSSYVYKPPKKSTKKKWKPKRAISTVEIIKGDKVSKKSVKKED